MRKDKEIQGFDSSLIGMDSGPQPGDFPIGSIESRAAARAQLERSEREPGIVISIRVILIGQDGRERLPPPQRFPWQGGVTEITHVAGGSS